MVNSTALPETLDLILQVIRQENTFCLSGHQNPDADVIGSQLAMSSLIRRLNPAKKVDILNSGAAPKYLSFLKGFESIRSVEKIDGAYDVVVVFECSGADRMGKIIDLSKQAKTVINIDHHLHNPLFGHINYVEPDTSSTAEIIFKIFERAGLEINKEEAVCLYTGLITDTGCFRYGNTNVQTHSIGARLIAAGVPVGLVSEQIYMNRSKPAVRLLAHALSKMEILMDDRVALLELPQDVFKATNATEDDIEEIVNAGLLMESALVSILFREKADGSIKLSLRSKQDYDVNKIARFFFFFFHRNASGATFSISLREAKALVVAEVRKLF